MRILLVNRFFGGLQTPTGRMLHDLANELAAAKHEIVVLTSSGGYVSSETGITASSLPSFDIRVVQQIGAAARVINWGWFWLNAVLRVPFMAWDRLVILTDPPFLVIAAPLSKLLRGRSRKVFWWTMDLYPEALHAAGIVGRTNLLYRVLRRLTDWALAHVDGVISLGLRQRERLAEYHHWRNDDSFCVVVPPWDNRLLPRPPPDVNPVVKRFSWEGRKVALYAGNLGEGHTFEEFVAAARFLHSTGRKDWLFVFAVRGSQVIALKNATASLPNVQVMDYLAESDTAFLLWAAAVHLVSMKPGWEGIIVPSKLYGVIQTEAQVLFLGPNDADIVRELTNLGRGMALPTSSDGESVARALDCLATQSSLVAQVKPAAGIGTVASFVLKI